MRLVLIAAGLAAMSSAPAHAVSAIIEFNGTVYSGSHDDAGLFGGGDLIGTAFTARIALSWPMAGATEESIDLGDRSYRYLWGYAADNPLSASLNVGGFSYEIGSDYGAVFRGDRYSGNRDQLNVFATDGISALDVGFSSPNEVFTGSDLNASFYYALRTGDLRGASFRYDDGNKSSTVFLWVESVSVAAVPEISTWSMMLGGFVLAGLGLRRRGEARVKFQA